MSVMTPYVPPADDDNRVSYLQQVEQDAQDLFRRGEDETDRLVRALNEAVDRWEDAGEADAEETRSLAEALPFVARVRPDSGLSLLMRASEAAWPPARRAPLVESLPRVARHLTSAEAAVAAAALAEYTDMPGDAAAARRAARQLCAVHALLMPFCMRALASVCTVAVSGTFAREWLCSKLWLSLLAPNTPRARQRASRVASLVTDAALKKNALRFFDALRAPASDSGRARLVRMRWTEKTSVRPTCALAWRGGLPSADCDALLALLKAWAESEAVLLDGPIFEKK